MSVRNGGVNCSMEEMIYESFHRILGPTLLKMEREENEKLTVENKRLRGEMAHLEEKEYE